MDFDETIRFKNVEKSIIDQLYIQDWRVNTEKSIEFFEDELTIVKLVSFDDQLDEFINWLDDGNPIAVDHQWSSKSRNQDENSITLFQFCSSKGVLLVQRNPETTANNESLLNFMKSHKLFAKTTKRDYIKFQQVFGQEASKISFEDITRTRLLANGESASFDEMVNRFCEKKPSIKLNNRSFQKYHWDNNPLKKMQVIFAGFRVIELYEAMKKFPEPNLHFISEDPNVPIPIQYIQGISRIQIKPKLKYMLIYDINGNTLVDLTNTIGLKKTFRNIYMFTKNGDTNNDDDEFDKAIIEVENLVQFHKKIIKANYKISPIDASLWEIEDNES